jgi:FkbH-like protein
MTPAIFESAKLIIWDLDGTFWNGIFGEEGAQFRSDMLEVVIELNKHGIISAIASHNDLASTREYLQRNAAWEHFVFPVIDWRSKTDMVRAILSNTQLRPQNTIFLDDTPRWRELVAQEIPELLLACNADDFVTAYQNWAREKPFKDVALERLQAYKLLERRQTLRHTYATTPEATIEFLRRSDIRCTITSVSNGMAARIHELILRTNQLNFTKRRASAEELDVLLSSDAYECRAVHVRDRFGDYGVCGFYALEVGPRPKLLHFLFSCRILHMGIEAAVYGRLDTPAIAGAGEDAAVDERLKREAVETDWVAFENRDSPCEIARTGDAVQGRARLTFIGPCELESVGGTIQALCDSYIATDLRVNFVSDRKNVIRHHGHHAFLALSRRPLVSSKYATTLSFLPWFDKRLIDMDFNPEAPPDVVVLSAVRNAQCADYRHKTGEFSVPLDYFRAGGIDFTSPDSQEIGRSFIAWYHGDPGPDFMEWFADNFSFEGPISGTRYHESLEALLGWLPARTRLVMVNVTDVSTVPYEARTGVDHGLAESWKQQHGAINSAIRTFNERHPERTAVIDVNRHVHSIADCWVPAHEETGQPWASSYWFFESYYHFQRQIYAAMVFDLIDILTEWRNIAIDRKTRESLEDMLSDKWWKV